VKALLLTMASLAVWCALPASALAADECTRIASPSGSDGAPGTEAAPLRTPQDLLDSLAPGETGCLRGGTYSSFHQDVLYPRRGGRPGAPLTIRSYPGERASLVGIIDIRHGSDYITLSGLQIEGTGEDGANTIKVYSRGVVIEDSDITNAWRGRSCLMLGNNAGGGQTVHPIIRRNTFHQCGNRANGNQDHGIYAANVVAGEIVDNLFYDTAAYAIQLYPNAQHTRFAHNVVDGSAPSVRGGVVFGGDADFASSDNVVERNVIAYAATAAITAYWEGPVGTRNVARDNCVWGSRDDDISPAWGFRAGANRVAQPLFASRSGHDYRLAGGSACLGAVGYDTIRRRLGQFAQPPAFRGRLAVVARRPRIASSGGRSGPRRVRLEFQVRGVGVRTARVVIAGRGHPRVRRLHVRGRGRLAVESSLWPGSYRAWAQVFDGSRDRTARSQRMRFHVS
jgi:hypothetical protein